MLRACGALHEVHELSQPVASVALPVPEQVNEDLTKLPSLTAMHCTSDDTSTTLLKMVTESTTWEQVVSPAGKASREVEPGAAGGEGGSEGDESQKVIEIHSLPRLVYRMEYVCNRLLDIS